MTTSWLKKKKMHLLWIAPVLFVLTVAWIDRHISSSTRNRLFTEVSAIPDRPVALVLGTCKYVQGRTNLFYDYRIEAAARLFKAGKVRGILVSGDNSRTEYDEPSDMKADLVKAGVPEEYITLDYAGIRTLDSIVRAKKVFAQDSFIVVSQAFHCQRAIYIADHYDLDIVGYVSDDVSGAPGMKIRLREVLARTLAFLDMNILGTEPRFLGKIEDVPLKPF